MKQITVNIPDGKFEFVMELFKQLGINAEKDTDIPQWQQDLVLKRIEESNKNPERLLNWNDVKDKFKLD